MIRRLTTCLLAAATAALPLPDAAATGATTVIGNPVEGNLGFGVIIQHDAVLGSTESEGPVAVGGNLSYGPGYNVALHTPGTYTAPGDSKPTALLVGGGINQAASASNGVLKVLSQGYVKIGNMARVQALNTDSNGASVNTQVVPSGAGYNAAPRIELTVNQSPASVGPAPSPIDFTSLFAQYRQRAQEIAACPENVVLNDAQGTPLPQQTGLPASTRAYITLTPGVTNVLKLSTTDLKNLSELTFRNQPNATTPLVVVTTDDAAPGGGSVPALAWNTPNTAGISGTQAPYILWDFPTTTSLTINSGDSLEGTIFAPAAALTDSDPSNIEGDVVAASLVAGGQTSPGVWENAGEIHYFPFNAELSCPQDEPTPAPSPTESPTPAPSPSTSTSPTPSPSTPSGTSSTPGAPTGSPSLLAATGASEDGMLAVGASALAVTAAGIALTISYRRRRGRHVA